MLFNKNIFAIKKLWEKIARNWKLSYHNIRRIIWEHSSGFRLYKFESSIFSDKVFLFLSEKVLLTIILLCTYCIQKIVRGRMKTMQSVPQVEKSAALLQKVLIK
jgi:hypothetical protein